MNEEIKEIAQFDATLEKSLEDFMENYKMVDVDQVYSNGTEFVPIFRVKQWLEYNNITTLQNRITELEEINKQHQELNGTLRNENERLKKALNCKEYFSSTMPEDTEFVILTKANYDRQQKDIQLELIDYKSRCEKGIEYIEDNWITYEDSKQFTAFDESLPVFIKEINELLNILQNGSDDNE